MQALLLLQLGGQVSKGETELSCGDLRNIDRASQSCILMPITSAKSAIEKKKKGCIAGRKRRAQLHHDLSCFWETIAQASWESVERINGHSVYDGAKIADDSSVLPSAAVWMMQTGVRPPFTY
jgi:hypothetical protein